MFCFLTHQTIDEGEGEQMEITERPYLVLDIRPEEQYESGHIVSAQSYPHVRLARAVNFETREMLAYKVPRFTAETTDILHLIAGINDTICTETLICISYMR